MQHVDGPKPNRARPIGSVMQDLEAAFQTINNYGLADRSEDVSSSDEELLRDHLLGADSIMATTEAVLLESTDAASMYFQALEAVADLVEDWSAVFNSQLPGHSRTSSSLANIKERFPLVTMLVASTGCPLSDEFDPRDYDTVPCLSIPLSVEATDPTALSGYTKAENFYLGLTRGSRFRSVLRSLTIQLRTALEHLTEGGTLVVQWRGVAHHPTLLFLLRGLSGHFSSIKLRLDEEDTENLGVYMICSGFKTTGRPIDSELGEDNAKGADEIPRASGEFSLLDFLEGLEHTDSHADDVLMWTLDEWSLQRTVDEYRRDLNFVFSSLVPRLRELEARGGVPVIADRLTTPALSVRSQETLSKESIETTKGATTGAAHHPSGKHSELGESSLEVSASYDSSQLSSSENGEVSVMRPQEKTRNRNKDRREVLPRKRGSRRRQNPRAKRVPQQPDRSVQLNNSPPRSKARSFPGKGPPREVAAKAPQLPLPVIPTEKRIQLNLADKTTPSLYKPRVCKRPPWDPSPLSQLPIALSYTFQAPYRPKEDTSMAARKALVDAIIEPTGASAESVMARYRNRAYRWAVQGDANTHSPESNQDMKASSHHFINK
ncbi:hypothetical protein FOZ63_003292 [Perkinsus olseni]|uniref:Uncharacterized protein n=1 Tax=Perkinsus olseni TaxID=32597 RepID=A0A7J6TWX3_PEROL|nr:hypothetical protein FOZ62_014229 [Perkinsus olseni]KAF4749101.1 hypothetical protein FOZ63_003292 [Perkinsus olseni]